VDKEAASGVPRSRIVLAGFSQGGAIAYTAAMRMAAAPLGGDRPAPATVARAPRPGCAMRARADLRTNLRVAAAGVVALSTWLPRCARTTASDAAKAPPPPLVLSGHAASLTPY
jgi:alpha-beta hydrolase superfamily lysophospholipase